MLVSNLKKRKYEDQYTYKKKVNSIVIMEILIKTIVRHQLSQPKQNKNKTKKRNKVSKSSDTKRTLNHEPTGYIPEMKG